MTDSETKISKSIPEREKKMMETGGTRRELIFKAMQGKFISGKEVGGGKGRVISSCARGPKAKYPWSRSSRHAGMTEVKVP